MTIPPPQENHHGLPGTIHETELHIVNHNTKDAWDYYLYNPLHLQQQNILTRCLS